MGIADVTWDEIEDVLDKYFAVPDLQPSDFSVSDVVERYGITRSTARDRVRQMLDDGVAELIGRVSGRNYYRVKRDDDG